MIRTTILLTLFLVITGCGNKAALIKQYHRLPVDVNQTTAEKRTGILVIKKPEALSILGGRPMVATQPDGTLVQLSHNFWLESPKVLLQDALTDWAEQHWSSVQKQTPYDQDHHQLETRILAFEKNAGAIHLSLAFRLTDQSRNELFAQTLTRHLPISGDGHSAAARTMGAAVTDILNQLNRELP